MSAEMKFIARRRYSQGLIALKKRGQIQIRNQGSCGYGFVVG